MDTLVLSLKRKSIKVALELEDGTTENFSIQELTGAQRDLYLTQMAKRMKYTDEGKPLGVTDFTGLHAQLLALSLVDEKGTVVPLERIQSWKSTVVQELFKAAQQLSGLNETGRAEVKND